MKEGNEGRVLGADSMQRSAVPSPLPGRTSSGSAPRRPTGDLLDVVVKMAAEGLVRIASGEFLLASDPDEPFGRLFGRDSMVTSLQLLSAARLAPSLAPLLLPPVEGSLRALARLQGVMDDPWTEEEPGKILHEHHPRGSGDFPGAYYASVDSTPLFLMALHRYAEAAPTIQPAILDELRDARDRALAWILRRGDLDADGLVEFVQRNPERRSLINQNWRDSRDSLLLPDGSMPRYPVAYSEVQAYCYAAVEGEARLRWDEEPAMAGELSVRARQLARRFERLFWLEGAGCYAQGLDADKHPIPDVTSNAFHWLWLGPLRHRRFRRVASRLLCADMMTPFGLRTLSSASPNYAPLRYHRGAIWPWDNWVAASALRRLGMEEAAAAVDEAVMRGLSHLGSPAEMYVYRDGGDCPSTSFVDIQGGPARACRIQGWTVGYLVEMAARWGGAEMLLDELSRRHWRRGGAPAVSDAV